MLSQGGAGAADFTAQRWRMPEPRNPFLWFGFTYLITLVIYGLYAWLVDYIMGVHVCAGRSCERIAVIGPVFACAGGVALVVLNVVEIQRERDKAKRFLEIVSAAHGLIVSVFANVGPRGDREVFYVGQYQSPAGVVPTYNVACSLFESALATLVALVLLLWQFSSRGTPSESEGDGIIGVFVSTSGGARGGLGFPTNMQANFRQARAVHPTAPWGGVMTYVLRERFTLLAHAKALQNANIVLAAPLDRFDAACNNFYISVHAGVFWWIKWMLRVLGVLMLFAVPFMLWSSSQGILVIAWSVAFFVIFYSVALYRLFIGDVMLNPTKWDMSLILDAIIQVARVADAEFSRACPKMRTASSFPETKCFNVVAAFIFNSNAVPYGHNS